ncbi:MAG TPA: oligopeptide ABC transporter permease [Thermomicrobiales bacterium]|nr:oligopeptide ABC transporter permease [Thermomicrobiales bacterium]
MSDVTARRVSLNDAEDTRIATVAVRSPWKMAFQRFRRNKLAVAGLVVLILLVLLAVFAPIVAQHPPDQVDLRARGQGPSWEHPFGTDRTGRDTFARTLYAGRVSLSVGVVAVAISLLIGTTLGAVAGFKGGIWDAMIMRTTDVIMTFPSIVIILTVAAITGPGLGKTMLLIGLLNWPVACRLVRSRFLLLREQDFVLAAQTLGASEGRLIFRHAFPNVIDVLIVYSTLGMAGAILLEAGLSFLGLGVQPPTASWGNMLNVARNVAVLEGDPWLWIPAGVAVILSVLSVNFVGDGLQEALDPRLST